jgi:Carboxypeptidase regulatory-like domain
MRSLVIWGLAGVCSAGLWSAPPQVPPAQPPPSLQRDAAKPQAGSGIIRGRVSTAERGSPVRRARVLLLALDSRPERTTTTDMEGRFELKGVAPGHYRLKASKPPWLDREYGQRSMAEAGTPLALADGQIVDKVDIALIRGGVITGRIVDDLGEPATNARVSVMRRVYRDGRLSLTSVTRPIYVSTDDVGQYRASGLAPGMYYVGTARTIFMPYDDRDEGIAYPAVFYPGTTNVNETQPVAVGPGEERANVDISLVLLRLSKLSGVVMDSLGRVPAKAQVLVDPVAQQGMDSDGITVGVPLKSDGRFTFPALAPGAYLLIADVTVPETGARETARLALTLAGETLEGLVLRTGPGARIAGRIEAEDGVLPSVAPSRIGISAARLTPAGPSAAGYNGSLRDDWSFVLDNLPSDAYLLRTYGLPAGWAIKAVLVGGEDLTDGPIPLQGAQALSEVRVVITNRLTEVRGTVVDLRDKPVRAYTVVVFAEDEARWAGRTRYCLAARADQDGRYLVAGLPPGEYRAAALEFLEEGRENDPDLLKKLKTRATRFSLAEREHRVLDLTLMRIEQERSEAGQSRPQ